MTKITDIHWIAGLLEGEGNFTYGTGAQLRIWMTDEDTISKARSIMDPNTKILIDDRKGNRQTVYGFFVYGNLAIQWMMTIYSLVGRRRKEKIREILLKWKNEKRIISSDETVKRIEQGVKLIAMSRNISIDEARKIYYKTTGVM